MDHHCLILCRWDASAVSLLPEYLHALYIRTLSQFKEFEDSLAPHEKHGVHYTIKAVNIMDHIYVLFRIISEDSVATC
jgi:hypothetical protein